MSATSRTALLASLLAEAAARFSPSGSESPVTTPAFEKTAVQMVQLAVSAVGRGPVSLEILSTGMRSIVLRVFFSAGTGPSSCIVKHFRRRDSAVNSGGFGYLREKHGLLALEQLVPGGYSCLLASSDAQRTVVLEDIYPAASCTDLLLEGGSAAGTALGAYTRFWTAVLTSPAQEQAQSGFSRALASADAGARRPGSLPSPRLALAGVERLVSSGSLLVAEAAHAREQVESIVFAPRSRCVFSSGDFSPANVLIPHDASAARALPGLRGIDAEGAAWHHPALALAEVILCFPSANTPALSQHLTQQQLATAALALARPLFAGVRTAQDLFEHPEIAAALTTVTAIRAEQKSP